MKKILIVLAILISSFHSFSQEFKRNEVFIELLGNGLLGSINYERQLGKKPGFGIRAGAGLYGTDTHMTIPVGVNYLIKLRNDYSFLDLGFGATFTKTDGFFYAITKLSDGYIRKKDYVYLIPSVGARAYTTKNFVANKFNPVYN
jgi:hypothetical protein